MTLEQMTEDFLEQVKEVIEGKRTSTDEVKFLPPSIVLDFIVNLDYDFTDVDFDSNGWQWDFWKYVRVNGKQYVISGCGWYGGLTFKLDPDFDEE